VGERSRPGGLGELLAGLGLEPDPEAPALTSLTIDRPPEGEPTVEVRRIETLADYLGALELDWDVWEVPEADRPARRAAKAEAWQAIVAEGRSAQYVALVDGEPVGFAQAVFAPAAAILLGGSTLPAMRGRGVYTSLVHARWRDAVARGTPRIAVSAGPMSAPILERLGFEPIGRVRLLRDRL
jgi:GNAT superfamily N-acetyltransferase